MPPALQSSTPLRGKGSARRHNPILFEFKPHHRNIPSEKLLSDLRRVARRLNLKTLNKDQYESIGQFSSLCIYRRFGSWNAALQHAGLKSSRNFRIDAKAVLADIRRIAKKLKTHRLMETQYLKAGRYSTSLIYKHFGTWQHAAESAGLVPRIYINITKRQLFENLERIWLTLKRQPRSIELIYPLSTYTITPYLRHFGSFQNALKTFVKQKHTSTPTTPVSEVLRRPGFTPTKTPKHKTPRTINHRLRYIVLKRDHFKCQCCGRSPATHPNVTLQIDHIHPWRHGGETVITNLQTLCRTCNTGKFDSHDL